MPNDILTLLQHEMRIKKITSPTLTLLCPIIDQQLSLRDQAHGDALREIAALKSRLFKLENKGSAE